MTDNKVKLNYDKAEVMIISPSRMSISVSIPNSFATCSTSVLFSNTINNLGVTVDCHLYFSPMPLTMPVQITLNDVVSVPFVIT